MKYPTEHHVTPDLTNEQVEADHMRKSVYYARKAPHTNGLQYDIMERLAGTVQAWIGSAVSYEAAIRIARALNQQRTND